MAAIPLVVQSLSKMIQTKTVERILRRNAGRLPEPVEEDAMLRLAHAIEAQVLESFRSWACMRHLDPRAMAEINRHVTTEVGKIRERYGISKASLKAK